MREFLEEMQDRRSVVAGLAAAGTVVIGGHQFNSTRTERNERAQTHLANAGECLDRNYDRFHGHDLSTPAGIYDLEPEPIRQDLDEAIREREQALQLGGVIGLSDELQAGLDELSIFIDVHETIYDMVALSGSIDGDAIHDERIEETLGAVIEQTNSEELSSNPALGRPVTPFDSDDYRDTLSATSIPDGALTDRLSHSVPELLDIAETALKPLSGLDLLHRQLVAHLELPILDQVILELDRRLSQANYSETTTENERLPNVSPDGFGFRFDQSLPADIESLTLADRPITAAEVEQSAESFEDAISVFQDSITAWEAGQRETSNERWSDGLTAIQKATRRSPFRR